MVLGALRGLPWIHPSKDGAAGGGTVPGSPHGGRPLCVGANPAGAAEGDPRPVLGERSDSLHTAGVENGER